jgi:head-tail adaptor
MTCLSDYDKRVTIRQAVGTPDAHGHIDLTTASNWSIYATAYCKVITKGGREFWKVQQVNADTEQAWTAQWSPTLQEVTPDMRLEYDGNVYEILSAIDVNMDHEEIQILTRRKVQ